MKIALLGDIAFFGKFSLENKNILHYFSDVAKKLKEYDYVIGNLETPLCDSVTPSGYKSAYIKSNTENVELLNFLNISAVNLSNNHIYDYGLEGYNSTKKILEKNNTPYFGIENKQFLIEDKNNKIAFSGYCCYSTNGSGYFNPKTKVGVDIVDAYKIERKLHENHESGYYNIASIHCGQEHVNYPNYDHVEMARKIAGKVPYVFYGHHPHVMQGIEKIDDSLLAYSLGNFCFDDVYTKKSKAPLVKQTEENKKSFVLVIEFEDNKIINYEAIPLYAGEDIMSIGTESKIIESLNKYSSYLKINKEKFIEDRKEILDRYLNYRKEKRDFNWYVKRLNFNSLGVMKELYKNKKLYKKLVKDYIN